VRLSCRVGSVSCANVGVDLRSALQPPSLVLVPHRANALRGIRSVGEMGANPEEARPGGHVAPEVDDVALDLDVEAVARLQTQLGPRFARYGDLVLGTDLHA